MIMKLLHIISVSIFCFNFFTAHPMDGAGVRQTHTQKLKRTPSGSKMKEVIISEPLKSEASFLTTICEKMTEGIGSGIGKGLEASVAQSVIKLIVNLFEECSSLIHEIANPKASEELALQKKIEEHTQNFLLLEAISKKINDPEAYQELQSATNKIGKALAEVVSRKISLSQSAQIPKPVLAKHEILTNKELDDLSLQEPPALNIQEYESEFEIPSIDTASIEPVNVEAQEIPKIEIPLIPNHQADVIISESIK